MKAWKYKARLKRLREKVLFKSQSPRNKLEKKMKKEGTRISPNLKKLLLFCEFLTSDLSSSFKNIKSCNFKAAFVGNLKLRYVKKYHFMNVAKPYFPVLLDGRSNYIDMESIERGKILLKKQ